MSIAAILQSARIAELRDAADHAAALCKRPPPVELGPRLSSSGPAHRGRRRLLLLLAAERRRSAKLAELVRNG